MGYPQNGLRRKVRLRRAKVKRRCPIFARLQNLDAETAELWLWQSNSCVKLIHTR